MTTPLERLAAALADRYRLERELGAGGMATVYLAEDLKHDRKVAIKVLKPDLAAVLGAERFITEIKTTAALSHPHILPLFDSGSVYGPDQSGPYLFYVMPYIEGETIREKLTRETQFGIDEAVRITREVADALDYAHRHGVIHRDIKPENILLHDGRAMVMDFGIALAVSAAAGGRMTETGLSLGTPHYMSPEQATADKQITGRSDIYSLASVLYEMLTGEPPHMGNSAQAIIMKIVTDVPRPVSELRKSVPPNVVAALARALEKVPADRFDSAKALADALANPAFTVAGADGAGRRPGSGRWRPWPAVATAAALFGAGLVVGGLLMSGRDRPSRTPGTFVLASAAVGGISYTQLVNRLAVARDGSRIAYVSADSTGEHVFVRGVADPVARPVAEGYAPFFSPDGASLGYCEDGVWTVPIGGGSPTRVYGEGYCASVSWDDDDRIRFTTGRQALLSVSPAGLAPDSLVFQGDTTVLRGELIGRGRLLLSLAVGAATPVIAVHEPDGRIRELLEGSDARLAPTDVLLFTRREGNEHVLLAVPFDRRRGALAGEPRVLERGTAGVTNAGGTTSGDLVYLAGSTRSDRQIVVTDFEGNERSLTADGLAWVGVSAAADGHTVIATSWNGWFRSLWSLDLRTSALSRLTRGTETFTPVPTPDGAELFYIGTRSDPRWEIGSWLQRQSLRAAAPPTLLSYPGELYPFSVSADGAWLYVSGPSAGSLDIFRLRIDGRGDSVEQVVATPAYESDPRVSPDDRWLAFASGASGTVRTVIVPLSAPTRPVPIGSGRGSPVGWTRNGTLFHYLGQTRELWSVEIGPSGPRPGPGRRRSVLPAGIRSFSLLPDGEHLVAVRGGPIYQDIIMAQGALARSSK